MIKLAIYGKGGIGKSTCTANLSAALAKLANLTVSVKNTNLSLGEREGVVVYGLNNSTITDTLAENPDETQQIALGDANGFAVVKDSGYRHKSFDFETVTLDGMMPKNAAASADDASEEDIVLALDEGDILAAYDISLSDNGAEYQPDAEHPIAVEIASDDIMAEDADGIEVWHIADDGTAEKIEGVVVEDGKVSFRASSFSVYAVTSTPRKTFLFYNDRLMNSPYLFTLEGSGQTTNKQILKNGESLVMPQLPELLNGDTFLGWYVITDDESTDYQQAFDEAVTVTADETINLYAKYAQVRYVTFYAARVVNNDETIWPVTFTRSAVLSDGTAAVTISDVTANPVTEADVFLGWTDTAAHATASDRTDFVLGSDYAGSLNAVTSGGVTTITITGDTKLYPVFATAHWFRFSSGEAGNGATYQAPFYQLTGQTHSALGTVSRAGYEFKGWYTAEDENHNGTGTQVTDASGQVVPNLNIDGVASSNADGNMTLSDNITLYAKWEASTSSYNIVYWVEQRSDETPLSSSEKKYDYLKMISLTATTNSTVSLSVLGSSYTNITQIGSEIGRASCRERV